MATAAPADGLAQLKAFHATTKSGKVTFRQVVAAKGRQETRESTGTFSFQRPGKFRWTYETPYEQLIVGDGDRLWIYDRDLNQVIVRKLDRALGSTPAALLAGDSALEANFDLTDAGSRDGVDFVEAKPRTADTGFERVRIGFADNLPRRHGAQGHVRQRHDAHLRRRSTGMRRRTRRNSGSFRRRAPTSSARTSSAIAVAPRRRAVSARSRRARADARGPPG